MRNLRYHVRYWLLYLRRWVQMPFSRWARHAIPIEELVAKHERDPDMRERLARARAEIRRKFYGTAD